MSKMEGIKILNDGNPMPINSTEGYIFTVSPSTAKKARAYRTDKFVPLTEYEKKMPGVVIGQDRGMLFSGCRKTAGDFVIPELEGINLIIVDEVSRKLKPVDDEENKIGWKGNGEHVVKDVIADGQGQHWFCHSDGSLADDLWLKIAKFLYGGKGMLQPGLATDIGCKVIDHWGVERTITLGNTLLLNSSMVKGLGAYGSLEELIEHSKDWGLTVMMKQWQSGDHEPEKKREMGTQPNATNLQLTADEISEMLKPEARKIYCMKYPKVAWMRQANIATERGRALAARPELMYNPLIMSQMDMLAGNTFLKLCQGKFKAEGQYLKMYEDKLVYSFVYVHGMDPNEAAKKAAETGLHGEIRVNPSFAGRYVKKDENGNLVTMYKKETFLDAKGRYIKVALVRYPHGAPSETIIVKAYLDATVPKDVIIFPAPVADENGIIDVKFLYAMRLQGADFDGDAVTAFTEKTWLEAQERNVGKSYMVIPVNTESTEKDKTLVTDETWEAFCQMKVESLTNQVGLIATSLKYFLSQKADELRNGKNSDKYAQIIVDHACAMGDDIDEFKHGKANCTLQMFVVPEEGRDGKDEVLYGPYFNRYAAKYKDPEEFNKAIYTKNGFEKKPGSGVLNMYAVETEKLMKRCGLPIVKEATKASDGKERYYFTVHPVQWEAKAVDLFAAEHGEGQTSVALPEELEVAYGIEHGTKLSAKELFLILYKDRCATAKMLMDGETENENRDRYINAIAKIDERYTLARVAIVAWAKAMKLAKTGETINAEDAIKLFTTLMTQHTSSTRSTIDVLTRTGKFKRADGSEYEKTVFEALRVLNYFLDVCGDGLLLQSETAPDFPEVSANIIEAAEVTMPDLDKAKEKARKQLAIIDKLVELIPNGVEEVCDKISENEDLSTYEDSSVLNDGSILISSDEDIENYNLTIDEL